MFTVDNRNCWLSSIDQFFAKEKYTTGFTQTEASNLSSTPTDFFFQSLCQGSHFPKSSVLFWTHALCVLCRNDLHPQGMKGHDWDLSSDLWPLLTETSEIIYNVLSACDWMWVEVHIYFSVLNMQCSRVTWSHLQWKILALTTQSMLKILPANSRSTFRCLLKIKALLVIVQ